MFWEWVGHMAQRAATRIGGVSFVGVVAIVADPLSFVKPDIHPAVYALGYTIIVALIVIRWVIKYGRTNVQRTPNGELSRMQERMGRIEARQERQEKRLGAVEEWKDTLVVVNGKE